jgi:hypothetical protein
MLKKLRSAAPVRNIAAAPFASIMLQCRSTRTAGFGSCPLSTFRSDAMMVARR